MSADKPTYETVSSSPRDLVVVGKEPAPSYLRILPPLQVTLRTHPVRTDVRCQQINLHMKQSVHPSYLGLGMEPAPSYLGIL